MSHNEEVKARACQLLSEFKGDRYAYGAGALERAGKLVRGLGRRALVVANHSAWLRPTVNQVLASMKDAGVELAYDGVVPGSRPNSPSDDVYRIALYILQHRPDCVVAVGGGSTIDATKAAIVAACFAGVSPDLEEYYGTDLVTRRLAATGLELIPMLAVMTAAGSGAHLTKYSNVTDYYQNQKRLLIDDAITPPAAAFDYSVTASSPRSLVLDGAFDGLSHCLEVFYGASQESFEKVSRIACTGIELLVTGMELALEDPGSPECMEALGLGTDLGGYAIMVGGTNGAHLNSFSFVDVASHGRACAVMNPYYTVFFAPAIERQVRLIGDIFSRHGYIADDLDRLKGRELGLAVARGMQALSLRMGFPTTLEQLPGFTEEHIDRALKAAKNPQLESKLRNMPVPMTADDVDEYMGPVLRAARRGNLTLIKNMPMN
ncbi:MAG: iron-containing alcohol dehydrogenase [Bacillota bacterium]|jgi:alcohol dehydrogenase|nr:iron-containing alcohol dehydrogenase [Bacillota bacterium]